MFLQLKLRNDSSASGKKANLHVHLPGLKGIKGCFGINKAPSLPYLANRKSKTVEQGNGTQVTTRKFVVK